MNRYASSLLLAPLAALVACASVSPHQMANSYEQRGEWLSAMNAYARILDEDPDDKRAQEGYRRCADAFVAQRAELVELSMSKGEFAAALQLADDTLRQAPDQPDAPGLMASVAERTRDAAVLAAREDRYERAITLYEALGIYAPEMIPEHREQLPKLRARWLNVMIKTAELAEREGRLATASLLWAKSHELSANPEHLDRAQRTRRSVVEAERWRVQAVLTPQLARVLERQQWPEGMAVALVENPALGGAVARARLGAPSCQTQTQDFQKTARVQVGVREVPSADYQREANDVQQAQDQVWSADRELQRARRDRDHAWKVAQGQPQGSPAWNEYDRANGRVRDAERELGWREDALVRERADLSRYQPYTLEPVYNDLPYMVNHITRRCTARIEISLNGGDPSAHDRVVSAEDETHPQLPALGLAQDPLQLPQDGELAAQIEQRGAELVAQRLLDGFRAHRQGVLARAQAAADKPGRLEAGLRYAMLAPDALTPDLLRELQDDSGISNIAHLLSRT